MDDLLKRLAKQSDLLRKVPTTKRTRRNILVTCGGKWVGHVLQPHETARGIDDLRDAKIFVADCEPITLASQFANGSVQVPAIADVVVAIRPVAYRLHPVPSPRFLTRTSRRITGPHRHQKAT